MGLDSILVITKQSTYSLYQKSDDPDIRSLKNLESGDARRIIDSHARQNASLEQVMTALGNYHFSCHDREKLPELSLEDHDLIISVGGDGTLLEISHYIVDIPVLSVNSDPLASVGYFSACSADGLQPFLDTLDIQPKHDLSRLLVSVNGTPVLSPALNDVLFAHDNPAATSRYRANSVDYKNGGLLVCTAAGSTAWMYNEGGEIMPLDSHMLQYHPRGQRKVQFHYAEQLTITALTRNLHMFIDGPFLKQPVPLGATIDIITGTPLHLYGDLESKRAHFKE